MNGACTPTNQECPRKTGLDTHVLLRSTQREVKNPDDVNQLVKTIEANFQKVIDAASAKA